MSDYDDCLALVHAGIKKFGSARELAKAMSQGRENEPLAQRLAVFGTEQHEPNASSVRALREQLLEALR